MAHLRGAARARYVRRMFDRIAGHYDLMNAIMTFGQYRRWQRRAAEIAAPIVGERFLDVATGTGDIATDLATLAPFVVGLDFSRPMLLAGDAKVRASGRIARVEGDALALPFRDNSFDGVTIGFGLRNLPDLRRALAEMIRVVRPGGRVVCLELTRPLLPWIAPLFRLYFHRVVPLIGGLVSGSFAAYRYLPQSVDHFPDAEALRTLFAECGLLFPEYEPLNFGTIAIHWGTKPLEAAP
ncbi:MAG: bifunctional demethylmenaquinone methyltransferase/2-methoxy-6-polyprenyl-1,4-benzoquinol methylase UbiE [Chloroflexota bacterium]|nr:bifunctional demethylmenaquinone methyltransferase/2-methoxy-6-polyprenyl-1,4-benzoquinol methylase UbiE [Dehalococcoidia bacterium]MDW8252640.1 bifunctional demethylmenaquinone methyltransferase/2-methoxy-6-polyprenyl-1,4-benzoquinol methylase UbiE [Chloroflexota bacterium]